MAASKPGSLCSTSVRKSATAQGAKGANSGCSLRVRVLTQQVSMCWLLAPYEARDGSARQQRLSTEDCCGLWAAAPRPAILSYFTLDAQ